VKQDNAPYRNYEISTDELLIKRWSNVCHRQQSRCNPASPSVLPYIVSYCLFQNERCLRGRVCPAAWSCMFTAAWGLDWLLGWTELEHCSWAVTSHSDGLAGFCVGLYSGPTFALRQGGECRGGVASTASWWLHLRQLCSLACSPHSQMGKITR
jgi:hypothetical protein